MRYLKQRIEHIITDVALKTLDRIKLCINNFIINFTNFVIIAWEKTITFDICKLIEDCMGRRFLT